jgi:ABC-2 type transport system permease protein
MRSFWKLTLAEIKLYFRFPIMAFFTLLVPPMLLILFGSIFGNDPNPAYGGYGTVDAMVPSFTALIICMGALLSLPITLANYRERGILRRYRATPVHPAVILTAQWVVQFLMTLAGMGLLILLGIGIYHMRFDGNAFSMLAAFLLSCLSFFALGMLLAGLLPSVRLASIVGNVLLYPMIYLSGSTIPMEIMPSGVRNVAKFIPLTYVVNLLQGLWKGETWSQHFPEVVVLGIMLVVCSAVAVKVFRWE